MDLNEIRCYQAEYQTNSQRKSQSPARSVASFIAILDGGFLKHRRLGLPWIQVLNRLNLVIKGMHGPQNWYLFETLKVAKKHAAIKNVLRRISRPCSARSSCRRASFVGLGLYVGGAPCVCRRFQLLRHVFACICLVSCTLKNSAWSLTKACFPSQEPWSLGSLFGVP